MSEQDNDEEKYKPLCSYDILENIKTGAIDKDAMTPSNLKKLYKALGLKPTGFSFERDELDDNLDKWRNEPNKG